MNNTYLAHIILPDEFDVNFYKLIPNQRMVINRLLRQHVVLSYSLDMERKNLWVFLSAKSEADVMDVLSTFPIIRFVKVNIHELAFHDATPVDLPELIMN
jgi:hypothetical protein